MFVGIKDDYVESCLVSETKCRVFCRSDVPGEGLTTVVSTFDYENQIDPFLSFVISSPYKFHRIVTIE